MQTKQMHSRIAVEQEIKQLKQHIVYLDRVISEKDHLLTQKHNELQATKFDMNKQFKETQGLHNKIQKNASEFLDKDRQILEL